MTGPAEQTEGRPRDDQAIWSPPGSRLLSLAGDGPLAFDHAVGVILAHTAIRATEIRHDSGSSSPGLGTLLRLDGC